jgi:hypothetical protein
MLLGHHSRGLLTVSLKLLYLEINLNLKSSLVFLLTNLTSKSLALAVY